MYKDLIKQAGACMDKATEAEPQPNHVKTFQPNNFKIFQTDHVTGFCEGSAEAVPPSEYVIRLYLMRLKIKLYWQAGACVYKSTEAEPQPNSL